MKYQAIDSDYIREMKERDEFLKEKRWLMKGMKYGYFIAILIIILSAFFNGNLVLATPNDISYTFQNNELYSVENPLITNSTNLSYAGNYTGHYNATYSFENEVGLIDDEISYIDSVFGTDSNYLATVKDFEDEHEEIFYFNTSGENNKYAHWINNIDNQIAGTIELWFKYIDNGVGYSLFHFYDISDSLMMYIIIASADNTFRVSYGNGIGGHATTSDVCISNIWYHVKLNFSCTTDTYSVWLNGILVSDNNPFYDDLDGTELDDSRIQLEGGAGTNILEGYVDAIGITGLTDNYQIGDNIISNKITLNNTQIDKWEFTHTEKGVYDEDQAIVPFWSEIDGDETTENGYVKLFSEDSDNKGIYKDDFTIQDGILNITLNFEYEVINVHDTVQYFQIFSYDTTEIVRLRIHTIGYDASSIHYLSYYDGASYNNISYVYEDVPDEFNLYIDNMITLRNNSEIISQFPLIDNSKKGLSQVKFYGNCPNGDSIGQNWYSQFHIESIGVYSNGTSLSNDYSSFSLFVNETWDSNEQHLFKTDIVGNCSIVALGFPSLSSPYTLYSSHDYIGEQILNVWNEFTGGNELEGWLSLPNCYLYFSGNESLTINSIQIEGVSLNDGTNDYYPSLDYSNVDLTESYYYVSNNRLYFTMTSNDTNLEYMEISFDVNDVYAGNRSLRWSGVKSPSSLEAQFKVIYTDSSYNPFELEPDYKNLAVLLPRTKTIDTFGLLISDNDNDVNDTITGFIGSFTLIYVPLITTDFLSISFFDALPIVVLVVVIPIALYVGFGRKKELLVPSIIAMSIFGTAVGLIPLWLTFVIGFGCVSYYIIDKRN